jgi:hypothetical protein
MAEVAVVDFPESRLPLPPSAEIALAGQTMQEVKSAVHRELIDKVDLEKLLFRTLR